MTADIPDWQLGAIFGPNASQQNSELFDHLVGEGERLGWNGDMKRTGGPAVDNEFKSRRLQHWNILRMLALEDSAGHRSGRPGGTER
jgi:hypothetical protein